jgi:hypothetical protein
LLEEFHASAQGAAFSHRLSGEFQKLTASMEVTERVVFLVDDLDT